MSTRAQIIQVLFSAAVAFSVPINAQAFDASALFKKEDSSEKIFESFFNFKKDGKRDHAVEVLRYAAEQGNSAAQWKLARIYQTGDGVKKDPLAAFNIFQEIAKQYPFARPNTPSWQFSADALVALGNYYRKGINGTAIKPNASQASVMYTTAAMVFRHPEAQFELGRMQLKNDNGFGQARKGLRNLGLAHEKGHTGAEALLGYVFFEGEHVKHNPVRGLVMLGRAKSRATQEELEWIGPLYDEANGLAQPNDRQEALRILGEQQ